MAAGYNFRLSAVCHGMGQVVPPRELEEQLNMKVLLVTRNKLILAFLQFYVKHSVGLGRLVRW